MKDFLKTFSDKSLWAGLAKFILGAVGLLLGASLIYGLFTTQQDILHYLWDNIFFIVIIYLLVAILVNQR